MLTLSNCRRRVERLRAIMERLAADVVVLNHPKNVYYFSGFLPSWTTRSALVVTELRTTLVTGANPVESAADELRTFEACPLGTVRLDQAVCVADAMKDLLAAGRRVGVEFSSCDRHMLGGVADEVVDVEAEILHMRRRKDEDELALIRRSAQAASACYARARELIRPGVTELELYTELRRAAVLSAGEPIGQFGNDFQCGTPGGPPRLRPAEAGELWILDLGIEYRGYFSDTCRTFVVRAPITDAQRKAWHKIVEVLQHVETHVRPGVTCRSVFEKAKRRLDDYLPNASPHHLGHGFGLTPHEAPHLNPHWDEVFEVGDTFTVEPGLYHESLHGGIRLENNYIVTTTGIECLTPFSLEMAAEEGG